MLRLSLLAVVLLPGIAISEEFPRIYVGNFDDHRDAAAADDTPSPVAISAEEDTTAELNAKLLFQLEEAVSQAKESQAKVQALDAKVAALQEGFQSSAFVDHRNVEDTVAADLSSQLNALTGRVTRLEGRMDKVEEQLLAILTVRKQDGSVTREAVEIDHVQGYGSFEVPSGGVVTHIDGKPVRRAAVSSTTVLRGTTTYLAAPSVGRQVDIYPAASQRLRTTTSGRVINQRGRLFNWSAARSNNAVCVGPDCR